LSSKKVDILRFSKNFDVWNRLWKSRVIIKQYLQNINMPLEILLSRKWKWHNSYHNKTANIWSRTWTSQYLGFWKMRHIQVNTLFYVIFTIFYVIQADAIGLNVSFWTMSVKIFNRFSRKRNVWWVSLNFW
jgi:hypothetical protein